MEFFHFKVMSLKTHEDTEAASECKLLFHFYFKMLAAKKRAYLEGFDWDVNYEPSQRLYLSKDTKRLMEVVNNFAATVYKRENKKIDRESLGSFDDGTDNVHKLKQKVGSKEEDNG